MRTHHLTLLALLAAGGTGCFGDTPSESIDSSGPVPGLPGRQLEPVVVADQKPPPIRGGTLLISRDGQHALASDADRDVVWVVSLDRAEVEAMIAFRAGEEPFRIVEGNGRFFVSLHGGEHVAAIDAGTWQLAHRQFACKAPRGLDYDASADALHVACGTGELLTLPATGGAPLRVSKLDRDLRDVVVTDSFVYVSRFRSAEVLVLDRDDLSVIERRPVAPELSTSPVLGTTMQPNVAWRMVRVSGDEVAVLHQTSQPDLTARAGVGVQAYYGSVNSFGCSSVINSSLTHLDATQPADQQVRGVDLDGAVLAVDVAFNRQSLAVAPAGNTNDGSPSYGDGTYVYSRNDQSGFGATGRCVPPDHVDPVPDADGRQIVAVAYDPSGQLVTQSRDPWQLQVGDRVVALPGESRKDSGHDLFHENAGAGVACASCHAEGQDDAVTWEFPDFGPRRTQFIAAGLRGTEPFHWSGDMEDFGHLVHEVFETRMQGPELPIKHRDALLGWIDRLPAPATGIAKDADSVSRGRELFHSAEVGCGDCHSGRRYSNDTTVDVGTGGAFQVPSLLGIANRAPFMHSGCAKTLRDRFAGNRCDGGDDHGTISHLDDGQIDDLVAFLETL